MIGMVDDQDRAFIDVVVRKALAAQEASVAAWIDTAFDGHLVFPTQLIEELGLEPLVATESILADGKRVTLETFIRHYDVVCANNVLHVQNAARMLNNMLRAKSSGRVMGGAGRGNVHQQRRPGVGTHPRRGVLLGRSRANCTIDRAQ